ncbi:MAG: hypothetical protein V4801_37545 [Burkholderia gladioli]
MTFVNAARRPTGTKRVIGLQRGSDCRKPVLIRMREYAPNKKARR